MPQRGIRRNGLAPPASTGYGPAAQTLGTPQVAPVSHVTELLSITVITVALSVVLHGVTAAPLAKAYGALAARMGECTEMRSVSEMPLRHGPMPDGGD